MFDTKFKFLKYFDSSFWNSAGKDFGILEQHGGLSFFKKCGMSFLKQSGSRFWNNGWGGIFFNSNA